MSHLRLHAITSARSRPHEHKPSSEKQEKPIFRRYPKPAFFRDSAIKDLGSVMCVREG